MKMKDVLLLRLGARDQKCPGEVDVLAYSENRLSTGQRVRIERHFTVCDDCRELLTFLGQESVDKSREPSQAEVSEQANRVLGYIRNDEIMGTESRQPARSESGFRISYSKLASLGLVVATIVVAVGVLLTQRQGPADEGMEALKLAFQAPRRTEARISGGFEHSRFAGVTRGDDADDDNLHFDRALGKLRSAEQENAPATDRLVLARAHLARGTRSDVEIALNILNQLSARGVETAEVLNDIGVADMQRTEYDKAIEFFTKALAKQPKYDEALFNKALAEQRANHVEDAKRDWQQFLNQSSDEKWKAEAADYLKALSRAR